MRVYDAKNIKYRDGLAEKRRKVLMFKMLFFLGLAIVVAGLILYLLFFSKLLDIRDISITGLDKVNKEEFNAKLKSRLSAKWLGYVEHQKNILFFNSGAFTAEVLSVFPEIKEIYISKNLPRTLKIDITERKTAGIWCFVSDGSTPFNKTHDKLLIASCNYFDKEGNIWGEAVQSSGFLILNVEDMRQDGQRAIDKSLLNNLLFISEYLKEMNIFVNKFTIPDNFFGDFRVITSRGFDLLLSTDSNIKEQLEVLKIFLTEKQKESSPSVPSIGGGFKPQYIDLRINGRVYYK